MLKIISSQDKSEKKSMLEVKEDLWSLFLESIKSKISESEFKNWFENINILQKNQNEITLEVPNIFVREYLLDNYKSDMEIFFPVKDDGNLAINFVIKEQKKPKLKSHILPQSINQDDNGFNLQYTFENFIEGPSNQFVKSAALGVAQRPGKSFNPLFIHGGVGLGKTHLLHGIGHFIKNHSKKQSLKCVTTEGFINDLVFNLKNKSVDRMKRFYRNLDVLLVDDIQFLQDRLNFEEEFCNTFESLINQNKQIVIVSDKPPAQLKLSQRLIARMEWGLVANVGIPDLETRVAILQHKAELKGLRIPHKVAFFIAEHIFNNVRQLEGAVNRLSAYCRLMGMDATEEVAENTLSELFQQSPLKRVSVEGILKTVATIFGVRVSDLKGSSRTNDVAFPRRVAMYLAKELINESLMKLSSAFGGKTHSTLLHAWKKVSYKSGKDETLRRQIEMARRNI